MLRKLAVNPETAVVVTENHGGYMAGRCVVCQAVGWLNPRYGYPHRMKDSVVNNRLIHTSRCRMNARLNDDGSLKK